MGILAFFICALQWFCLATLLLLGFLAIDFFTFPRTKFASWTDLLKMYFLRRVVVGIGMLSFWLRGHGGYINVREEDEKFVLKVTTLNAETDYGRDHKFSQIRSLDDFRRTQPVTDYEHYRPYVDAAMKGHVTSMFAQGTTIGCFSTSSGTTGAIKYIPTTEQGSKMILPALLGATHYFVGQYFLPMNLRKILLLPTAPKWRYTQDGVKIGPITGYEQSDPLFSSTYTTPPRANIVTTEAEAMHVGYVLSLRDPTVHAWEAAFVFTLYTQLQFLERNWRQIVEDIWRGRLSTSLNIDDSKRRTINSLLSPEPARAAQLQIEFEKGFDGIISRIFPHITAVNAACSGSSMAQYESKVRSYLGDIPIVSPVYDASEGEFGLNVQEPNLPPAFAVIPGVTFIEFLPVNDDGEALPDAMPLLSSEVTLNQLYETVITSSHGFYRYRMGDIVRIVGTYHQSPTFDFQFRRKQMLSVHMEKVSEAAFTEALKRAVASWPDHELVDFTTAESVLDPDAKPDAPPYYLVFLELNGSTKHIETIDQQLQDDHGLYRSLRMKGSIGPMRVVRVRAGTFEQYREHVYTTTETTSMQYKPPRVLRSHDQVQFFLERVTKLKIHCATVNNIECGMSRPHL